ncbi:MAG: amidohydrolase, partial [Siphonobacter sp.]
TLLDMLVNPDIIKNAWDYYSNVQTKETKYEPLISKTDKPAINLNTEIMAEYREKMKKYYYDPTKYKSYMEQLGIKYPTIRTKAEKEKTGK